MSKFKNAPNGYQNFGYGIALAATAILLKQVPKNNSVLDPMPVHYVLAKVLGIEYSVLEQFFIVYEQKTRDGLMVGMENTPGYVMGKNML
jgi:hypothetical protein